MNQFKLAGLAGLAFALLAGAIVDGCHRRADTKLVHTLQQARDSLSAARTQAGVDSATIAALAARTAQRDTVVVRVRAAERPVLAAIAATPVQALPDTCQPAIKARDSLIALRTTARDSLAASLFDVKQTNLLLTRDVSRYQRAAEDADSALRRAQARVTTPPASKLPRLGLGLFAGVTTERRWVVGAGVTMGWQLR